MLPRSASFHRLCSRMRLVRKLVGSDTKPVLVVRVLRRVCKLICILRQSGSGSLPTLAHNLSTNISSALLALFVLPHQLLFRLSLVGHSSVSWRKGSWHSSLLFLFSLQHSLNMLLASFLFNNPVIASIVIIAVALHNSFK